MLMSGDHVSVRRSGSRPKFAYSELVQCLVQNMEGPLALNRQDVSSMC